MMTPSQKIKKKCSWTGKILQDVVATHIEEAAFLWLIRERGLYSAHYRLDDFIDLDERIEGHLQGIFLSGGAGLELCDEMLDLEDAGEIFAYSAIAIVHKDHKRIENTIDICIREENLSLGLISALGWLPWQSVEETINRLIISDNPVSKGVAIASLTVRRRDPGAELIGALQSDDDLLKRRGLHALGLLGKRNLSNELRLNLEDKKMMIRYISARSGAILGDEPCIEKLYQMLFEEIPWKDEICGLVFRRLGLRGINLWRNISRDPLLQREAVVAAGAIGDPALVPWLIEQMGSPQYARVSGEAFAMITGAHFELDQLWGDKPAPISIDKDYQGKRNQHLERPHNDQNGIEQSNAEKDSPIDDDDPIDEIDMDEDLYWPDCKKVNDWWRTKKANFQDGSRYLIGQPISSDSAMRNVLKHGFQRQRIAAALELMIMDSQKPLIEVRSPYYRR